MLRISTIIFSILFLNCCSNFAKGQVSELDSLNNVVEELYKELNSTKEKQDFHSDQINSIISMIDTAFDGTSAELSASSNSIGIFGIIIGVVSVVMTIISVVLGIYLSRIEKSVRSMRSDSELLLQKNIAIKSELQDLGDKITKDTRSLYKLIRNEESNVMLERLIAVPEDIHNLFYNLASRDLEKEHFFKLKEAFLQLKKGQDGYNDYLILFFQHFTDLSMLDSEINPHFLKSLNWNFSNAFKNDVLKSTSEFFSVIMQNPINKSIGLINTYVLALCKSPHSKSSEVYLAIDRAISDKENKFQLYDIISKAPESLDFRKNFGIYLVENYSTIELTEKQKAIIEEIKTL